MENNEIVTQEQKSGILETAIDSLKKTLGIFTRPELQTISSATGETVAEKIDDVKRTGLYFMIGGLAVLTIGGFVYFKIVTLPASRLMRNTIGK